MLRSFLITSPDELADHEDRWEALRRECGGTVFASNYLIRTWFEAYGHIASPRVIMIEDNGDLVSVAPMTTYRYYVGRLPIKVLALAGEMKDRLRLSTISPLYTPGRWDVLKQMLREIKRLDWSLLTNINMAATPANAGYIEAVKGEWQSEEYPSAKMLTLRLPETGSLYDALDKKARKNLRWRAGLLEREGHKLEYRHLSAEDIDRAVDEYARQHIERWASRGGSYFRDPDNVRYLKLSTAASYRMGRGSVTELLIDGRVAAQSFDILDGKTGYGDKIGMSDEFMRYSPGWLVTIRAMDELRDLGAENCFLGIGGEGYKYEMGGVEEPLLGIRATRGMLSLLSRASGSSMLQKVGSKIGLSIDEVEVDATAR